jgi:hypothetical protein
MELLELWQKEEEKFLSLISVRNNFTLRQEIQFKDRN